MYLNLAKHLAIRDMGPNTMRQNRKIQVIGNAARTYQSAVAMLDSFLALDNLRQEVALEQARKDAVCPRPHLP